MPPIFSNALLDESDPNIRELAVHLAMEHWKIGRQIAGKLEQIAVADPSSSIRSMAIVSLSRIYRGEYEPRLAAFFARIVSDVQVSLLERQSAYLSLVLVADKELRFSTPEILLNFPAIINWDFVNNYLDKS